MEYSSGTEMRFMDIKFEIQGSQMNRGTGGNTASV
jgi:hypothetical protein